MGCPIRALSANSSRTRGGSDGPIEPPSEGSPVTSVAPTPGSSPGSEDETRDTAQAQLFEGPVESPAPNVSPYADPVDGLALTNVRLAVAVPFRRDSFRQLDDTISIDIEGERFTATGRGHVKWECDGVQFKTVVGGGGDARVYLKTTAVDSCRTPENQAGRGPWSVSFTVTGRLSVVVLTRCS